VAVNISVWWISGSSGRFGDRSRFGCRLLCPPGWSCACPGIGAIVVPLPLCWGEAGRGWAVFRVMWGCLGAAMYSGVGCREQAVAPDPFPGAVCAGGSDAARGALYPGVCLFAYPWLWCMRVWWPCGWPVPAFAPVSQSFACFPTAQGPSQVYCGRALQCFLARALFSPFPRGPRTGQCCRHGVRILHGLQ
jgi:hypothetical protein